MNLPYAYLPPLPTVHAASLEAGGVLSTSSSSYVSTAFPAANRAIFQPFNLVAPITVTLLVWVNGASPAGNIDVGIYSQDFVRLVSVGGVAQSGISNLQQADVTDTLIGPGLFYLAVSKDDTATMLASAAGLEGLRRSGLLQQAAAYPLPATATPVALTAAFQAAIGLLQGGTTI